MKRRQHKAANTLSNRSRREQPTIQAVHLRNGEKMFGHKIPNIISRQKTTREKITVNHNNAILHGQQTEKQITASKTRTHTHTHTQTHTHTHTQDCSGTPIVRETKHCLRPVRNAFHERVRNNERHRTSTQHDTACVRAKSAVCKREKQRRNHSQNKDMTSDRDRQITTEQRVNIIWRTCKG